MGAILGTQHLCSFLTKDAASRCLCPHRQDASQEQRHGTELPSQRLEAVPHVQGSIRCDGVLVRGSDSSSHVEKTASGATIVQYGTDQARSCPTDPIRFGPAGTLSVLI